MDIVNKKRKDNDSVNILVVDDNPKNLFAMKNSFQRTDVSVYTASSGKAALSEALTREYAFIFLDIQMPEMDGYEVAECLSNNARTAKIPIIFLTAIHDDPANVIKGYESGGSDYISKPVDPRILEAKAEIFIELYRQQKKLSIALGRLSAMANEDSLTKLPNRHQFNSFLEKSISLSVRHKRKFALLLLDIDGFKQVNDGFGHDIGDKLLIEISNRISSVLRDTDFIARLGGDEFAIIISDLKDEKEADIVCKKLLGISSERMIIDKHEVNTHLSIGVSTFPLSSETPQGLYKAADTALYEAKARGKNIFLKFTEKLREMRKRTDEVGFELRSAIENGEFDIVFHPRYNLSTDKLVGVEAEALWISPTLGHVTSAEFVPIAEESGFMPKISEALLHLSLLKFKALTSKYKDLTLSLSGHLSPAHFAHAGFANKLRKMIKEEGIYIEKLEFSLTESSIRAVNENIEKGLQALREVGAVFSIASIETDYASLSRLKQLAVKCIMIDKGHVQQINEDSSILKGVLGLVNTLGWRSVADGVETEAQVAALIEMGCTLGQGPHYAKYKSAQAVLELASK